LAEKLDVTQITYVEELVELDGKTITVQRNIGNGWQRVSATLPVLLTVTKDANEPRITAAKKMMKYKNAVTLLELEQKITSENPNADPADVKELMDHKTGRLKEAGLLMRQWNLDDIDADLTWCGQSGSPTKVHRIQSVVLTAKESKGIAPNEMAISDMIHELIQDKIIA
jgi:electron transfer flavoprotein beta subunit